MDKPLKPARPDKTQHFIRQIGAKETRKLRAQRRINQTIWTGFGLFGLIGWSVVVPTLAGTMFGIWLDKHHPSTHSWTLSLLILGLFGGCWNAWYWMSKEKQKIHTRERQ